MHPFLESYQRMKFKKKKKKNQERSGENSLWQMCIKLMKQPVRLELETKDSQKRKFQGEKKQTVFELLDN